MSSWMEYQAKLNKKYMSVLHCISVLKVILIKSYKIQLATSFFISCCFTLAFTSGDIIFYKFLELHSTLSEKIFLSQIFLFYWIYPTPQPLNGQNLLSVVKAFCRCSLTLTGLASHLFLLGWLKLNLTLLLDKLRLT